MMTEAQLRARCLAAGETCQTAAVCSCHHMSAYQPTAAPDQPPLLTMPGDLSENHEPPKETCWICMLTVCAAVLSAVFVGALVVQVVLEVWRWLA